MEVAMWRANNNSIIIGSQEGGGKKSYICYGLLFVVSLPTMPIEPSIPIIRQ